jgi:hypothetical protein
MAAYLKTILIALQFILLTAVLSAVFGLITQGRFTLDYVFTANFFIGAVIICVGLFLKFFPGLGFFKNLKDDKLTDHSTFNERFIFGIYLPRQEKAYGIVLLGLAVIIITGLIELIVWVLIPAN